MSAIECHCALCGKKMLVLRELAGRMTKCPACARDVPIPGFSQADRPYGSLPDLPAGILSLELKFLCRNCGARLVIDARQEGQSVYCPACKEAVSVPFWSGRHSLVRAAQRAVSVLSQDEIQFLCADPEARSA
jgi:DNA-directed RNA polymerase subunit RPC12/RpoP